MKATGSQIIIHMLEKQGIDIITGIPGGANLPLYDALAHSSITHILARHEQGSGFISHGMARSTGKPAVTFATSGPGATNLLTAIADARLDSVPLIAITGQVPLSMMGSDAFQEVDTYGMSIPITKHTFLVRDARELFSVIPEAFRIATEGRPGPVLVDVPKDIQKQEIEFNQWPEIRDKKITEIINKDQVKDIAGIINDSKKPLIMAGGGIISACSSKSLRELSHTSSIPVVTTLMGLGIMDHNDPLNLGMPGMHGAPGTNMILNEADLLIALGIRFDDRAICKAEEFCPNAQIIHVDIDKAELGKIRMPHHEVHGDLRGFFKEVLPLLENQKREDWVTHVLNLKKEKPMWYDNNDDELHPITIIKEAGKIAPRDAIITTDVGQHQMWAAQWYPVSSPRSFLTSGGLGTMGFGLPAAIGAALANPEKSIICFSGDGSILMNIQELATLADLQLNVKIILLNNSHLGLVRQQQEMFFDENYIASKFITSPDFSAIASAFGIRGCTLSKENTIENLKTFLYEKGPGLIDVPIDAAYNVLPMVPPGSPHYTMIGGTADDTIRTYRK